jgi:short-subunit dehydrogenase
MMDKRTALITGAIRGTEAEYARMMTNQGCDLINTGRRTEKINALSESMAESQSRNVEVVIIELSDAAHVEAFVKKSKIVISRFRSIMLDLEPLDFSIMNSFQFR